jgi:hypothetical protein
VSSTASRTFTGAARASVSFVAVRLVATCLLVIGCGSSPGTTMPDGMTSGDAPLGVDGSIDPTAPTAAQLLGVLATCTKVGGNYATDEGGAQTIPICGLASAVFWKADLDVDCDGKPSSVCSAQTDSAFQAQTSAVDSHGDYLDAATLPYVVVPLPSARFDYTAGGLELGSVIAVIYQDKVEYGVFGDEGPTTIIGEASHRMAELLGIDPNPETGGADSGAAYIAFTGPSAVVTVIEDHDEAVNIGITHARALLAQ